MTIKEVAIISGAVWWGFVLGWPICVAVGNLISGRRKRRARAKR